MKKYFSRNCSSAKIFIINPSLGKISKMSASEYVPVVYKCKCKAGKHWKTKLKGVSILHINNMVTNLAFKSGSRQEKSLDVQPRLPSSSCPRPIRILSRQFSMKELSLANIPILRRALRAQPFRKSAT